MLNDIIQDKNVQAAAVLIIGVIAGYYFTKYFGKQQDKKVKPKEDFTIINAEDKEAHVTTESRSVLKNSIDLLADDTRQVFETLQSTETELKGVNQQIQDIERANKNMELLWNRLQKRRRLLVEKFNEYKNS